MRHNLSPCNGIISSLTLRLLLLWSTINFLMVLACNNPFLYKSLLSSTTIFSPLNLWTWYSMDEKDVIFSSFFLRRFRIVSFACAAVLSLKFIKYNFGKLSLRVGFSSLPLRTVKPPGEEYIVFNISMHWVSISTLCSRRTTIHMEDISLSTLSCSKWCLASPWRFKNVMASENKSFDFPAGRYQAMSTRPFFKHDFRCPPGQSRWKKWLQPSSPMTSFIIFDFEELIFVWLPIRTNDTIGMGYVIIEWVFCILFPVLDAKSLMIVRIAQRGRTKCLVNGSGKINGTESWHLANLENKSWRRKSSEHINTASRASIGWTQLSFSVLIKE